MKARRWVLLRGIGAGCAAGARVQTAAWGGMWGGVLGAALRPPAAHGAQPVHTRALHPRDWQAMGRHPGVVVRGPGMSITQAYVMFDPNCPWSARLWRQLYPEGQPWRYATTWVAVAHRHASSAGRCAAIVGAAEPAQALRRNFKDFEEKGHRGGIEPAPVSAALQRALHASAQDWKALGGITPLTLLRLRDDSVQLLHGVPPQGLQELLQRLRPAGLARFG